MINKEILQSLGKKTRHNWITKEGLKKLESTEEGKSCILLSSAINLFRWLDIIFIFQSKIINAFIIELKL